MSLRLINKPRVHRRVAELLCDEGQRCDVATIHSMENFVFCFVFFIPLFRGLVYWTNEDPISV